MPNCAVATCTNCNKTTKNVRFYTFPKNEELAKQWTLACRRKDKINLKNATICSIHFETDCFELSLKHRLLNYSPKNTRNIKPGVIPTLNLPGASSDVSTKRKSGKRSLRMPNRRCKVEVEQIMKSSTSTSTDTLEISDTEKIVNISELTKMMEKSTQTSSNFEKNHNELENLRNKVIVLETQNKKLLRRIEEIEEEYNNILGKLLTPEQIYVKEEYTKY